ncbi:energy-coupling factor transporter transmembrane component T family protein [Glutamicibacter uratoxydans]|uniref:energy-coupling factor transporter transmembrane component T family protein n=1 Tax=Glutamicibacter uratoxydans TaxID=43667 RepID=UPI003D6ECED9
MLGVRNNSWLAQVPAALKFGSLLALSIGIYLLTQWLVLLLCLLIAVAVLLSTRAQLKQLLWPFSSLALIAGLIWVLLGIQTGWEQGAVAALRLLTLCVLAYAVSLSTTFEQMLDLFQKVVSPLRVLGANPAQISLGLALTIRFIPELQRVYFEVREAQHARGLQNNPMAISVPLVIRSLRIAEETAEALDARGYDSNATH